MGHLPHFQRIWELVIMRLMFSEPERGLTLPDPAERQRILERASLILVEAQALLDRLETRPEDLLATDDLPRPETDSVAR